MTRMERCFQVCVCEYLLTHTYTLQKNYIYTRMYMYERFLSQKNNTHSVNLSQ